MQLEVNRDDFHETRTVETRGEGETERLEPGQIRLSIERFALTTNNITYAVAGDMLDYWGFFPAEPGTAPTRWGRIPAMGLGSIVESAHPDLAVGGRYFGFYPMAAEVVINAGPHGSAFRDLGPHRANHAATYTDFRDVTTDAMFRPDQADEYLLLWGVFMTSFLIDDYRHRPRQPPSRTAGRPQRPSGRRDPTDAARPGLPGDAVQRCAHSPQRHRHWRSPRSRRPQLKPSLRPKPRLSVRPLESRDAALGITSRLIV